MNDILKGLPEEAWPTTHVVKDDEPYNYNNYRIGKWIMQLFWDDDDDDKTEKRHAKLIHTDYDHTAWVAEMKKGSGTFENFDIGGS